MPRRDEEPTGIFGIYARLLRWSRRGQQPGGGKSAPPPGGRDPAPLPEGLPRSLDENLQVPEAELRPCGKPFSFPVV